MLVDYYLCCTSYAVHNTVLFLLMSVLVYLCTKSEKLLIRNWCKLVGTCAVVNARSD